jgi:hypothetical protein
VTENHPEAQGFAFGMPDVSGAEGSMYVAYDAYEEALRIVLAHATPRARAGYEAAGRAYQADREAMRVGSPFKSAGRRAAQEALDAATATYEAASKRATDEAREAQRASGGPRYNNPAFRATYTAIMNRPEVRAAAELLRAADAADATAYREALKIHEAALRVIEARRDAAIVAALGARVGAELLAARDAAAATNTACKSMTGDEWDGYSAEAGAKAKAKVDAAASSAAARAVEAYRRVLARTLLFRRVPQVRRRPRSAPGRRAARRPHRAARLSAVASAGDGDPAPEPPPPRPRERRASPSRRAS